MDSSCIVKLSAHLRAAEWLIKGDELYVFPNVFRRVKHTMLIVRVISLDLSLEDTEWNECFAGDAQGKQESNRY